MFSSSQPISGPALRGRFMRHSIHSENLGGERTVTVRLPDNYTPSKKYPVLYMHDGQNIFDSSRSFGGREWRVDETLAGLTSQGRVPDAIVVAVDNSPARMAEYTHVPDREYGGGDGKKYENFFLNELLPTVESAYSINSKQRVLMGSSLGGLVSLTMGLNSPNTFAAVAALSPSLWWADGQLATETLSKETPQTKPRVWIDMGTEEGSSDTFGQRSIENGRFSTQPSGPNGLQDVRDRTREMGEALLTKGWTLDQDLRYHEPLGATHSEPAWAARFGEIAEWAMTPFMAST